MSTIRERIDNNLNLLMTLEAEKKDATKELKDVQELMSKCALKELETMERLSKIEYGKSSLLAQLMNLLKIANEEGGLK